MRRAFRSLEVSGAIRLPEGLAGYECSVSPPLALSLLANRRSSGSSERPVAGGEIAMRRAFRSLEVSGAIRSPEGLAGCE